MVHKVEKHPTDEMDKWIADLDKQQEEYLKSLEEDMKRQEEDFKKQIKEAEAFAIGTYETVKEVGKKAKKGVEVAKEKVGEIEKGAKEVWQKIKGAPKRTRWFEREPVRVYVSPEIQKKREKEEKKYLRIEE